MSNQMQITLRLYCDQSQLATGPAAPLTWELLVNGEPFPCSAANLLETTQIDGIVKKLVEIEDEMMDRDA